MADHQIYQGDVFELADQATRFVMTHISHWVGTRAEGDSVIVPTKYELPYDAVKEAVVNAICHRDYTSHQSVQVMLFADRLEVWNAGRLPKGLTIADLKKAHSSLPPNELLALPMYLKGAIEKTGTGTEDMVKQCRSWGLADPEFQDGPDFRVVIRRQKNIGTPASGTIGGTVDKASQETTQEITQKTAQKVLSFIGSHPRITRAELAKLCKISPDGIKWQLNRLKVQGLIRRVGPDKGGHWEVVKE